MNKKTVYLFIVAVVVVGFLAWTWMKAPVSKAPDQAAMQQGNARDSIASINNDLNATVVNDPDYTSIDGDLNSL
jgi:hypothetical protein